MYPICLEWPIQLHTYGVFLAMAFVAAISLTLYHGNLRGWSPNLVIDLSLNVLFSSIIGARVLYILLYPKQFPTWKTWFALQEGGLVFFGGFIAATAAVIIFCYRQQIFIGTMGDTVAPSLALGHFVGRLGCFMNGCCFGKPTSHSFGIVFPILHDNIPRHPTQLYEAVFLVLMSGIMVYFLRRQIRLGIPRAGAIWGAYIMSYAGFRFAIESIRGDNRGGFFTAWHFSISQCISLAALIGGICWMIWIYSRTPKETETNISEVSDAERDSVDRSL